MTGECGDSSQVVALDKRDFYLVVFISRLLSKRTLTRNAIIPQGNTRNSFSIFRSAPLAYPPCVVREGQ